MSVEHSAYRQAQVFTEPWFYNSPSIGEGTAIVVGPFGDTDPRCILTDLLANVVGGEDLYVATTLTDAVSGTGRFPVVATTGLLEMRGEIDQLVFLNVQGSGGATVFKAQAARTPRRNSGRAAGHPGTGEFVVRVANAANTPTVVTIPVRNNITVTAVKTYSKTVATSSGGTYLLTVAGDGNNLLSATNVNLELLTTVTLQSQTLTATTANRNLDRGTEIVITATSNNADLTAGDLLVAVSYTLR